MKKNTFYIVALLMVCWGCKKDKTADPTIDITWDGNLVPYAPVPVTKTVNKKVFAHYMPWFETKLTNGGYWGQHWTMTNQNPEIITDGKRQIASHYYPLNTGPYATSDTLVIDYQLLLMKLSGIDGIFIDWPGTLDFNDYKKNLANSNVVISRLKKVGLKYAIVYEDQNLKDIPGTAGQLAQAKADMLYIQNNYFDDDTYETFNGKPLLLDFGPFGPLQTAAQWNEIFGVMSTPPAFFPYQGGTYKGGTNVAGEFAWVQQTNLSSLNNFYSNGYDKEKMTAVYPGFNTFYAEGGTGGPTWTISYTDGSSTTFEKTLSLAIDQPGKYMQLVTWNDWGEGTIIEPTTQYQYQFLTTLQQQLQVQSSLSKTDLEAVAKLYNARKSNILPSYNSEKLKELNQVYYYMVSLKTDSAKALLAKDF